MYLKKNGFSEIQGIPYLLILPPLLWPYKNRVRVSRAGLLYGKPSHAFYPHLPCELLGLVSGCNQPQPDHKPDDASGNQTYGTHPPTGTM